MPDHHKIYSLISAGSIERYSFWGDNVKSPVIRTPMDTKMFTTNCRPIGLQNMVHLYTVCKKNNNGNYSITTERLLSAGDSNWRLKNFSCNVVLCIISHDRWSKHASSASLKFSIPLENNFFVSVPGDHGKPSKTIFLVPWKFMATHLLNFFNFWKFIYFFLGPGSHKLVMFNALWKQFKMGNIRKMIRCYINILVSYIT